LVFEIFLKKLGQGKKKKGRSKKKQGPYPLRRKMSILDPKP
jgi:hypothetical protein